MGRAWLAQQLLWPRACFTTSCQPLQTSGDGNYLWTRRKQQCNADICTALMELCCLHRSEGGWDTFAFLLKHLLPGVGCWGELLFVSGLCEDPASLWCSSTEGLVFPFFGGPNILIFCLFVCDFLRAEFVYCYGFRSKEIKAIENIGQSADLYQNEKTARQMHIHMYTIPTHIGSNVLVGIEEVWNIIKCWTD